MDIIAKENCFHRLRSLTVPFSTQSQRGHALYPAVHVIVFFVLGPRNGMSLYSLFFFGGPPAFFILASAAAIRSCLCFSRSSSVKEESILGAVVSSDPFPPPVAAVNGLLSGVFSFPSPSRCPYPLVFFWKGKSGKIKSTTTLEQR